MQLLTVAAPTQKIIDATSSNWTTVEALLVNWDDVTKSMMAAQIDAGSRLIIHEDGATTIGEFVGGGWYEISSAGPIYSWLQGEVVPPMEMRAAASPVRTLHFEARQRVFESWNPYPTCTYNFGAMVLVWYGTCLQSNPVYFYSEAWGSVPPPPNCPNIKREHMKHDLPGTDAHRADTWDYYAWEYGQLKFRPASQANAGVSGKVSPPAMTGGASNSPASPEIGPLGEGASPCSCDPVSLHSGAFIYNRTDISVGSGSYPYSLEFNRFYSSGQRLVDGPLGLGWSHNFAHGLSTGSNAIRALGALSPKEAAAAIAHCFMMLQIDLPISSGHVLTDFLIATTTTQWLMDQLSDNAVNIQAPGNSTTFIKLFDDTYNPMPGYAHTLTKNIDGYTLTSPQQLKWTFDVDGLLETFDDPAGVTVTHTYTTGKLTGVSNGLTRSLTFIYTGDRLTEISDGDRSVFFTIDVDGNLTEFTDADSKTIVYDYESPGLLTQIFLPANPVDAFVTNVYDSLYRIMTQTPSNEGTWIFYIAGFRSELVDPLGNSNVTYFNPLGSPLREIDAMGDATTHARDGLNRLISTTWIEGNALLLEYDNTSIPASNNVLTKTWQPKPGSPLDAIEHLLEYDSEWNKVSKLTDGEGNETTFDYDETQGTLLTITRPDVDSKTPTITFTYNERGQVLTRSEKVTQPESPDPPTFLVDRFDYDETSEVLLEAHRDPDGEDIYVVLGYTAAGDVNSVTDPRGNETTLEYDNERRPTKRIECAPFNFVTNWIYNENGELITLQRETGEVDPEFQEWHWTRNVHGDVVTITDPAGKELNFELDDLRRLVSRTDAEGRVWQFSYDPESRIITVIDPMGETSEARTFTENGMLATITDARNNTTVMQHDGFDRLSKRVYPDSTFEQFGYNLNSQVLTMLTRKGDTITNTFDVLTRLATRDPGSLPMQTMGYDLTSRLLTVSTPAVEGDPSSGLFSFGYDTAGRLISQSSPTGEDPPAYREVAYELDKNGNRTRLTWPDFYYAEYFFDELNRLEDIKLNGSSSAAIHFAYDNLSRREALTYINGCETSYGFAINNDLTSLEHAFVGGSVTFAYSFNDVHQVTEQDVSDAEFLWKPTALAITNYAPANNLNQYPAVAGNACNYDDNGNMTSGPFTSAAFDVINRVTQIVSGGITNNYLNDPLNRQAQKEVDSTKTGFLYDGVQLIAEYNSGGSMLNRYIPGARLDEILVQIADPSGTPVTTYLHQDRLGSTVAQSNSSGAVLNKYQYSPFGETPSLTGTLFGFTCQRYDSEIGQYNYKLRQYAPGIGRFLQPDPLGFAAGDMNLYTYVNNDPANLADPLGLFVVATYSQSTHTLTAVDSNGKSFSSSNFFSGNGPFANQGAFQALGGRGPIPQGDYFINTKMALPDVPNANAIAYPLEPMHGAAFQDVFGNPWTIRGGFELHPGLRSNGCVTCRSDVSEDASNYPSSKDFDSLSNMLETTSPMNLNGVSVPGILKVVP
ncbi:MAG: hypothetical protein K2W95_01375 [Candidatus Obscuribacterales bacterium]|nr:hypothetical protein [Candidatus Obscuribacterales bacterium]